MNRALFAAVTGMAAQQTQLDVVANNLANAGVAGFKGAEATFAELATPGGGLGTVSTGTSTRFDEGKLMQSGGPFDVAIDGEGFFAVRGPRGQRAYTRDGSFSRDATGSLRNARGYRLEGVRIPADATHLEVATDGTVSVQTAAGRTRCGHIAVVQFAVPERLAATGGTMFAATASSGPPRAARTGADGGPAVRFGMLEQSNVSIVEAMMAILEAQRAYEANAKGVQAADEMMRIANNLSRG